MKDRKRIAVLGVALGMGMIMAGCAKKAETPQTEEREISLEEMGQPEAEDAEQPEQDVDEAEDAEQPEQDAGQTEDKESADQDAAETNESNSGQTVNVSQDAEHLSGKVQSPREDGMILAQTTLMDEEGMVTLLDVKDAKKIPVKFTTDTRVEHWVIQGGGADIDMKEAAFSDLEEGQSVELEGYFEGEDFVAAKVIIEEYV